MRDLEKNKAYHRAYYAAHREEQRARSRAYHAAHREERRASSRVYNLKHYGITPVEYDNLLKLQGGVCALCRQPPNGRRLAVDHDHKTGKVRGILCIKCNRILEQFELLGSVKIEAYLDKGGSR